MVLILHIVVALTSLVFSTFLFFKPSQDKLKATYALVALTLASGTYVAIVSNSHLLEACMSGLFYLGAVSIGLVRAQHKLASVRQEIHDKHQ